MVQNAINLTDDARVVEAEPEELSDKLVGELIDLVLGVEDREEANNGSKAAHWFYQVPCAGVRYYSYE